MFPIFFQPQVRMATHNPDVIFPCLLSVHFSYIVQQTIFCSILEKNVDVTHAALTLLDIRVIVRPRTPEAEMSELIIAIQLYRVEVTNFSCNFVLFRFLF